MLLYPIKVIRPGEWLRQGFKLGLEALIVDRSALIDHDLARWNLGDENLRIISLISL